MEASVDTNVERAWCMVREAASGGADLVCLPELFACRYFCQQEDEAAFGLAEAEDGELIQEARRVAKSCGVVMVVPFFERRAAGVYHNAAAVIERDGRVLGIYRKMHIPDDPGFCEKYYFCPGDGGFPIFDTSAGKIGVLICWDQWFPEASRLVALKGAELIVFPTAIGWHPWEKSRRGEEQHDAWRTVQRSHAVCNGCYIAAVNRAGFEPKGASGKPDEGIEFWGRSFVAGPGGAVLAEAGEGEELVDASLDFGRIEEQRIQWPFFRDRRIDAYGDITGRFTD